MVMYKQILKTISEDIDWMALMPLLLFFGVFLVVVIAAFAERKSHIDYMAGMPLQKDPEINEIQS